MTAANAKLADEFEVTRCGDCQSDLVYAFEDSDGGMCTVCKLLISGPIRGGLGKHEMRRRRGELPVIEIAPETIKPAVKPVSVDVRNVKAVMATLGKSSTSLEPVPAKPKGPGFIEKTVGFFRKFQSELEKTKPKEVPKAEVPAAPPKPEAPKALSLAEQAKRILLSPAPVPAPPKANSGPQVGERWSIGPCVMCGLSGKRTGAVTPHQGGKRRYVIIDNSWHGCFMCAKRM